MFKQTLLITSLFFASINAKYVKVEAIEHYQNNSENKEFIFHFASDYLNVHHLVVNIKLYDEKNNYLLNYSNELSIIANKVASAKFKVNKEVKHAIIEVIYDNHNLIDNCQINFYYQDDCYLQINDNFCNQIYKSEYVNKESKDYRLNLRVKEGDYKQFLPFNYFNPNKLEIYSNYDFNKSNSYLLINEKITEFNVAYNEGYKFLLEISKNKKLAFSLAENYYVNLKEFAYSEEYQSGYLTSKNIYFPYSKEYKEYSGYLVIEDFITIRVKLEFATKGELFGSCLESKYCLRREKND